MRTRTIILLITLALVSGVSGRAVIFFQTGDPTHNTTPPTGALADSGWQYQGYWQPNFSGTAIAPHYFITAKHVHGTIGEEIFLNGAFHRTTKFWDDPESDLRIWQVREPFLKVAPLYSRSDEVGKAIMIFGRGTQRGAPIMVGGNLKGWKDGVSDTLMRWGQNTIDEAVDNAAGPLLKANFQAKPTGNEATLSYGDSGGAIFIKDGAIWKLAGINYAIDGPFNTSNVGDGFTASVFDRGGLYERAAAFWVLTPDLPTEQSASFYATRISSQLAWIQSVLTNEPPVSLQSASTANGPYNNEPSAVVGATSIEVVPQGTVRYYRLAGPPNKRITSVSKNGSSVVLRFE